MNLSCVNENVARIQHEIKLIRNELTEVRNLWICRKKRVVACEMQSGNLSHKILRFILQYSNTETLLFSQWKSRKNERNTRKKLSMVGSRFKKPYRRTWYKIWSVGYKTNEIRPTNRSAIPLPNDQNKMVRHNKMSFPQKIWDLAHQEDTDGFFQWSSNGQWITIERELFEVVP